MKNKQIYILTIFLCLLVIPQPASAMHIMEGFLPIGWVAFWWIIAIPFIIFGLLKLIKITKEKPNLKLLLGVVGAFVFVLSSMKIPSVTGSSSHMTGVALGAILFGPSVMVILGGIVLLFQALLLAHGGITTFGANLFSMAIVGPIVAYYIYLLLVKFSHKQKLAIFFAAFFGDLVTYLITSLQLALAFPAETGGILTSFGKFATVFAFSQIPLAIIEGLLTVIIINLLIAYNNDDINELMLNKRKGLV